LHTIRGVGLVFDLVYSSSAGCNDDRLLAAGLRRNWSIEGMRTVDFEDSELGLSGT